MLPQVKKVPVRITHDEGVFEGGLSMIFVALTNSVGGFETIAPEMCIRDRLHPSLALVSAGENNRYKHPNDETLERFKQRHIKVLRTDKDGAIRFKGWFKWSSETVR